MVFYKVYLRAAPRGGQRRQHEEGLNLFFWVPSHGPNPGSRAQNLGLGQMRSFLIVLGGVYTKRDHIWPKPIVLGPEPGVWARCGHFSLTPPSASQKPS